MLCTMKKKNVKTIIGEIANLCIVGAKTAKRKKYENEVVAMGGGGGGEGARSRGRRSLDDLFGNESHGRRPPAAIFCRAFAYRYGCIFKGCHVKRQARPLNTFKFINGEGYTL